MSLTLHVDGERWREHLHRVAAQRPGLVPVAKGNGYGLGNARLARRADWLGANTLAVGTYDELADVSDRFPGDLLVLTPWRPFLPGANDVLQDGLLAHRVIHTVSRPADLDALISAPPNVRVVLERSTSMLRHGMSASELIEAAAVASRGGVRVEGVALHLPLATAGDAGHLDEMERLLTDVYAAGLGESSATVFVSHLSENEIATLAARHPGLRLRPRIGTELWLGDPGALRVTATVLDAHPVARGTRYGYWGRRAPKAGTILVVSGGTAHGIGLESPLGRADIRARAATVARGGLDALGMVRSPYRVGGHAPLFAEPPHMQASMLFLPGGTSVPEVGSEIDVRVRHTATGFDRVVVG